MIRQINFDMDGTLVDFYGVENWLDYLIAEDVTPYAVARPLVNMNSLARVLNRLQRNGYKICIISWTSKCGSDEYNKRVTEIKRKWLAKHLASVQFDEINIIKYGTPKYTIGSGILFDDEEPNRNMWGDGAYDVQNIIEILKGL